MTLKYKKLKLDTKILSKYKDMHLFTSIKAVTKSCFHFTHLPASALIFLQEKQS